MDHAEIKSELNKRRLAKTTLEKNLSTTQGAIQELRQKRSVTEHSMAVRKQERKEQEREEALRLSSADLETEIATYESEMSELLKEKKEQLNHYSFDKIKVNFFKNSPLSEDTLSDIQALREEASDTVSERFVEAYFNSLGRCRVSEEDFLVALENLGAAEDKFFDQRSEKLNVIVNKLTTKIKDLDMDLEDGESKNTSAMVIGLGVVTLILSFFIYPFYSLLLCVTTFFNVRESMAMKYSLDFLKVVEDNFKLMEKALIKRATSEYQRKQDEINEEFAEAAAIIQQDIDEVNKEISDVRQKALADFTFDGSEVEAEVNAELANLDHQIGSQCDTESDLKTRLLALEEEINKYMEMYDNSLYSLEKQYIDYDRIGDSKVYPNRILLAAEDPPVFFKNTNKSIVFIYKDKISTINFIKLITIQLRCNVHPSSSTVEVWDSDESGVHFMSFRNTAPKGDDGGFRILNTTDQIKEAVISLEAILQKRLKSIRVSYNNIEDYNSDMIKLNSVTENFYTIFVLSPESLLGNESFKRLLVNGPDLGIYIYTFVDVLRMSENWIPVLERVNSCALIQNGKVATNAVDAVISKIQAQKDTK